jgi:hypothetical protein
MANHNLPTQTSGYINFVQELDNRFDDLARGLDPAKSPSGDPTISNLPVDSIGWSSQNNKWRKWNGSTWVDLVTGDLYGINISGNAATVTNGVYTTGTQTIGGIKTFSSQIVGDISGNAGSVTNGVYTIGNQTIAGVKTFSSQIIGTISGNSGSVTNGVYTVGDQTISGTKTFSNQITANISGNAGSVTNGVYTAGDQTIGGVKTFNSQIQGSISGTAGSVVINYNNDSNSTYQMLWGSGNGVYATGGIYCNPSSDWLYAASFSCSNWHRSTGDTGWYNDTHSVGIYATEAGNVRTYNNANFISGGDITAFSDETLKTNWRELPIDYIEQLAKVKHGIYDRLDCENKTQVGVGAQSLRTFLPNAIIEGADGKLSVAYGNAAMVSSVKLAERVVEQDKRILELERLVSKLIGE